MLALIAALGCNDETSPTEAESQAETPAAKATPEMLAAIERAEARGDASKLDDAHFTHHDASVRRRAARALTRSVNSAQQREQLARMLADEDLEVVAWVAHGLGKDCEEQPTQIVRALVARAASLLSSHSSAQIPEQPLDPVYALADSLGRCATAEAELSLRAWLQGDQRLARVAALGLGRLAGKRGSLDDASVVALLDRASEAEEPLLEALYPFTRLRALDSATQSRLHEVSTKLLRKRDPLRVFAVRALGRTDAAGLPQLANILSDSSFTVGERGDAVRELARQGEAGQAPLRAAFARLWPQDFESLKALVRGEMWPPVMAALEALEPPAQEISEILIGISELPLKDFPERLRHRAVRARCAAASVLAGTASLSKRLARCDPEPQGRIGQMAVLEVLDRGPLRGPRWSRYQELAQAEDPAVRAAALKLLKTHPEVSQSHDLLSQALSSSHEGLVIVASEVLSVQPQQAGEEGTSKSPAIKPSPQVVQALEKAWKGFDPNAIAAQAAWMEAAAALQLLSAKPRLEAACKHPNRSLRAHAERGLRLLGDRRRNCASPIVAEGAPPNSGSRLSKETTLIFETSVGDFSLVIDPRLAPRAAWRVVELAKQGFYDGVAVHRVLPGFITQFGDPDGDGYGGAKLPPLGNETAPLAYTADSIGLALPGPEMGKTQIFVTLGRYPHLDGNYPWLGEAGEGWNRVVEGDLIRKVWVR